MSSDHGELLGERLFPLPFRAYGHPIGIYMEELVNVPCHVYTSGERQDIVAGAPGEQKESMSEPLDNSFGISAT